MRVEKIGNATLYYGDCRDVLAAAEFGAIVTDPPYGLNESWGDGARWQGKCGKGRLWNGTPEWDRAAPEPDFMRALAQHPAIIWGGNYFDGLPVSKGWLVWDKAAAMRQAQAELAWTNVAPTVRVWRKSPLGVFGNGGRNGELKEHPTQKPTELMRWCLDFIAPDAVVCDPFMGSGTTGVACAQTGRAFIGIERDPEYFEIAARRIREAQAQGSLLAA